MMDGCFCFCLRGRLICIGYYPNTFNKSVFYTNCYFTFFQLRYNGDVNVITESGV